MSRYFQIAIITVALMGLFVLGHARAETVLCSEPVGTGQGLVRGLEDSDYAACVYKGIPYAAPPVGDRRFCAPEPPEPHSGILDAYEFGPSCPQDETLTSGGESAAFSENCLYLNIWRPKKSGVFPVMYWIHGGGNREGAGTYDMFDGARLAAEREVVLVTINYRIGALGFIALPELKAEDENGSTGNYAYLDQIEGLRWVRDNIAAFGGDPDNITIFGQSAGGGSVCILLASPQAAGLFHRAISMSAGCSYGVSLEKGYQSGEKFCELVGCTGPDRLSCLRAKTEDELVLKSRNLALIAVTGSGIKYNPIIDDYVLPNTPINCIKAGNYNRVPVMLGHTRDEVRLGTLIFPGLSLLPRSATNYIIRRLSGDELFDDLMKLYSYSDYKNPSQLLFAIANEGYIARGYEAAEELAPRSPVYLYRFDWDENRFSSKVGAFHGLDIPFVFGKLNIDSQIAKLVASKKTYEQAEPLVLQMMSYYTNFAKNGDPNGEGLPYWPAYTRDQRQRIILDIPITAAAITEQELEKYRFFVEHEFYGFP